MHDLPLTFNRDFRDTSCCRCHALGLEPVLQLLPARFGGGFVVAGAVVGVKAVLGVGEHLGGLDHGDLPTSMLSVVGSVRSGAPAAMVRTRDTTGRWVTIRAAPLSDGASVVLAEAVTRVAGVPTEVRIAALRLVVAELPQAERDEVERPAELV